MRLRAWLLDEQRGLYLLIAAVIGCGVGRMVAQNYTASDFTAFFGGAQALVHGVNPWHNPAFGPDKPFPFNERVYYPLPTLLFLLPLTWLSTHQAASAFMGLSSGLLAYAVLRTNPARLPLFLSAGFLSAMVTAQWSVLALAVMLLPALDTLWWLKPTYGLVAFVMRPRLRGALIFAAVGLLGLVLVPSWPLDWLRALHDNQHPVPLTVGLGPLLLLAGLCWRRPEGRVLLALALVPHGLLWYDGLLVWIVPRTWKQSGVLLVAGLLTYGYWIGRSGGTFDEAATLAARPLVIAGIYLPALGILLWQERHALAARWPRRRAALAVAGD